MRAIVCDRCGKVQKNNEKGGYTLGYNSFNRYDDTDRVGELCKECTDEFFDIFVGGFSEGMYPDTWTNYRIEHDEIGEYILSYNIKDSNVQKRDYTGLDDYDGTLTRYSDIGRLKIYVTDVSGSKFEMFSQTECTTRSDTFHAWEDAIDNKNLLDELNPLCKADLLFDGDFADVINKYVDERFPISVRENGQYVRKDNSYQIYITDIRLYKNKAPGVTIGYIHNAQNYPIYQENGQLLSFDMSYDDISESWLVYSEEDLCDRDDLLNTNI